jgi:hypothetical protein
MPSTITKQATEMKKNVSESLHENSEKLNESLDGVKKQLLSYSTQIQEYLGKVDASIDGYKFSIEKQGDGLTIDIAFRATVHPKTSSK